MQKLVRHQTSLFLAIIIISGLLIGFGLYVSSGRDDAHITFFPAYTLAEFGEIQNYNGERVEQSSTLLLVLLLALASKVTGIDVAVWGYILPIVFYSVVIVLTYRLVRRLQPKMALLTACLVSTTPFLLYWTFGKMEATLTTAIMLGGILLYHDFLTKDLSARLVIVTVLITAALALVRPEMSIVLFASLVGMGGVVLAQYFICRDDLCAAQNRQFGRRIIGLTGIITLVIAGLFLFRYVYFGVWFPQPVYAKVSSIDAEKLEDGIAYLLDNSIPVLDIPVGETTLHLPGIWLAILGSGYLLLMSLFNRLRPMQLNIMLTFLAVYAAYIITTGGDWMEGGRFNVIILPLLLLAIVLAVNHILNKFLPEKRAFGAVLALVILGYGVQIYQNVQFMQNGSTGLPLPAALDYDRAFTDAYNKDDLYWFQRVNRVNSRDISTLFYLEQLIDELLASTETRPLTILSRQQGLISYTIARKYRDAIVIYDRAGLIDGRLINCDETNQLKRSRGGVRLYPSQIFTGSFLESCGLDKPDIIFELTHYDIFLENGYTLYFLQQGDNMPPPPGVPGVPIFAEQSIYVRSELLPPDFEPIVISSYDLLNQAN